MHIPRPNAPGKGYFNVNAGKQTVEGKMYRLREKAEVEMPDMMLRADEIDYDEETGEAEARGHVFFQHYSKEELIVCDKAQYNTDSGYGKFFNVRGYAKTRIDVRPGMMISDNPFYFEGEWAERIEDRYILHNGMITGCKLPNPWWTLTGPKFDIVPGERAVAYNALFRLRKTPLFFTPFFYKSLEKEPRKSGFLTPNIGNSSVRGVMLGLGYYWAINRSYDVLYRFQDFTSRGYAHHVDFRGKPTQKSDFDMIFYGVQDRGIRIGNFIQKQGGFNLYATGHADLGKGWEARGNLNYLSSLLFRQSFSDSFNEAIVSESHSVGYLSNHFSSFTFNAVVSRLQTFQDITPENFILIRKLPEAQFSSRDRQISSKVLPLWVSFDSSAGLLYRSEPAAVVLRDDGRPITEGKLQTRQLSTRADMQPRVMTAFRFRGFHLIPSFTLHETHYGQSYAAGRVVNDSVSRHAREVGVELITPTIERVFKKKTIFGDQLKHVIEPRASYRYVGGVNNFDQFIRFDETELLSNTSEVQVSLTNRVYSKRGDNVAEIFSWQLAQRRYFDPTFGGALIPGQRNVLLSSVAISPYTFLDQPRNYSPVASIVRAVPLLGVGLEWRADYDPLRQHIVDSGFTADYRRNKYFVSAGHNQVRSDPAVSPSANQFRGTVGYGDANRRGWNTAITGIYDYRQDILQFATATVNYNTDCCGVSVQFRRLSFGSKNDNQFRLSFSIANVGSFGTLRKQERLF